MTRTIWDPVISMISLLAAGSKWRSVWLLTNVREHDVRCREEGRR